MDRVDKAKQLRAYQTDAEKRLWYHLRAHRFMGLKFKRQKPLGPYIVDFVCMKHAVIIEVDGGQHNERQDYDERRTRWFVRKGFTVLRFWNHDVLNRTMAVLERIREAVDARRSSRPSPPAPLPQAGEGRKMQT